MKPNEPGFENIHVLSRDIDLTKKITTLYKEHDLIKISRTYKQN